MLRRILPLLLLSISSTLLFAQVNSPYSRYGLGNIFPTTFGASNGMSGLSAAFITPININYQNPASYADLLGASFDVGVAGNVLTLNTDLETFTSGNGNLSNLAFGFPLLKNVRRHKLGFSFGLIPYSAFQYDIIEEIPTDDNDLGIKRYNYVGDGELYQVYGGLGYKFQTDTTMLLRSRKEGTDTVIAAHLFSIGGNSAALFGSLFNLTYASFPDVVNSQTTKLTRKNEVNGGLYNAGIAYQRNYIRKKGTNRDYLTWKFGGAYTPQLDVRGDQSILWTNILKNGNYEFVTDTIYSAPDTSGNIRLPMSFQGGLTFSFFSTDVKNKNQFTVGAQYSMTQWSKYEGFQDAGQLGDSWRVSVGAEFIPKIKKSSGQKENDKPQFTYRAGFYTGTSNLLSETGESLSDVGVTAGFAIPLGRGENVQRTFVNSRMNIYLNIGQRGANTGLAETYYNFGVSFSIVDTGWFIKYKLN